MKLLPPTRAAARELALALTTFVVAASLVLVISGGDRVLRSVGLCRARLADLANFLRAVRPALFVGALGLAASYPARMLVDRRLDARRSALGVAAAALATGLAYLSSAPSRSALVHAAFHAPFSLLESIADDAWTTAIAAAAIGLCAVLWGTAALTWARLRRQPTAAVAAVTCTMIGALVAFALSSIGAGVLGFPPGGSWCGGWRERLVAFHEELLATAGRTMMLKLWVLAAAAAGTIAILWSARRETRGASRAAASAAVPWRVLHTAMGVFALGLAAFALTRAQAADEREPPMLRNIETRTDSLPADLVPAMPRAEACHGEIEDAPLLVLRSDGEALRLRIDGVDLADAQAVRETLEAKAALWKVIWPNRAFPARLLIAASARLPLEHVVSLLRVIRGTGFTQIFAVEVEQPRQSLLTYTLGEVPYAPRACGLELARTTGDTWGDAVSANRARPSP